MSTPKPRDRDAAEDRPTNLARYVLGGFGENATATLGIDVKYPTSFVQGVTVLDFQEGSTAEAAGIEQFDIILEVDSTPSASFAIAFTSHGSTTADPARRRSRSLTRS